MDVLINIYVFCSPHQEESEYGEFHTTSTLLSASTGHSPFHQLRSKMQLLIEANGESSYMLPTALQPNDLR